MTLLPLCGVRMDHVVGGRNGGELHARLSRGSADRFADARGKFVWKRRQSGAGHVVLRDAITRAAHRREHGGGLVALKGLRENPEFDHRPPETSLRRTGLPVAAERAMATMARTDAMPSSMSAPRIGAPFRIVSANPSNWRR